QPDRVVHLRDENPSLGIDRFASSMPNFRSWQAARGVTHLSALYTADSNLIDGTEPIRVPGLQVSTDLWDTLEVHPVAGRRFIPADDEPGSPPVAMIGEGMWKRRYGGDPAVIGRTVDVNLVPHTIIGIVPHDVGFAFDIDLWLPLGHDPEYDDNRGDRRVIVLARLAPGVTLQQAQEEMSAVASELEREFPEANRGWTVVVEPIRDFILDAEVAQRLRIVLAAVALLLLVAC